MTAWSRYRTSPSLSGCVALLPGIGFCEKRPGDEFWQDHHSSAVEELQHSVARTRPRPKSPVIEMGWAAAAEGAAQAGVYGGGLLSRFKGSIGQAGGHRAHLSPCQRVRTLVVYQVQSVSGPGTRA